MGVDLETHWHPTTKLNIIGSSVNYAKSSPLPSNVTRDEIEEYCYTVAQLYEQFIESVYDETTLSHREAQTWILRQFVREGAERLSFEAIGLYIWAIGRATEGDPLSRTIVSEYFDRAHAKMQAADSTLRHRDAPPYPDDVLSDPVPLWVESSLIPQLAQAREGTESFADTISRLLLSEVESIKLKNLIDAIRQEHDQIRFIGVQTVQPRWDRELPISVHVSNPSHPSKVGEADVLTVDGHIVPFSCEIRSLETSHRKMLPLFSSETPAERGLANLARALAHVEVDLSSLICTARETGVYALGMKQTPVGGGGHLVVVVPDEVTVHDGREESGFIPPDRIELIDRVLTVERVSSVLPDAYEAQTTTAFWVQHMSSIEGPTSTPTSATDERERIPTPVLRTG
ncbi:MAG: hypothetical protein J07HQX50_01060 [Haloquadratum sp. J07HQX50]|jgi:hypothetical protein|nr:MAG: hypothetical protein J07HQX50_01060 [Haloquadratum sp. J07HQX50]